MKECGVIFQGWGVRAIRDDLKTMTRRLPGLERVNQEPDMWKWGGVNKYGQHIFYSTESGEAKYPNGYPDDFNGLAKCPYGKPGDRLWVRETHAIHPRFKTLLYRSDGEWFDDAPGYGKWKPTWTPSIHMFRKDSRIDLENTDVRVERVQDILDSDAVQEGAQFTDFGKNQYGQQRPGWRCDKKPERWEESLSSPKWAFANIWDSINGKKYPWSLNPHVWIVEFKRI